MSPFFKANWSNIIMALGATILTFTNMARGNGWGTAAWAFLTLGQLAIIYKRYKDNSNK